MPFDLIFKHPIYSILIYFNVNKYDLKKENHYNIFWLMYILFIHSGANNLDGVDENTKI